jgi:hypothetical protein
VSERWVREARGLSFYEEEESSCKSSSARSYSDAAIEDDGTLSEDVGCLSDSEGDKSSREGHASDDEDLDEKIKWFFMRVEE